jgi:hypothetical protein
LDECHIADRADGIADLFDPAGFVEIDLSVTTDFRTGSLECGRCSVDSRLVARDAQYKWRLAHEVAVGADVLFEGHMALPKCQAFDRFWLADPVHAKVPEIAAGGIPRHHVPKRW